MSGAGDTVARVGGDDFVQHLDSSAGTRAIVGAMVRLAEWAADQGRPQMLHFAASSQVAVEATA